MLNEFDQWLEAKYLNQKARRDRGAWNFGVRKPRPIAIRENRQWKPAVTYCRYCDDFVVIVKGTKAHAEAIREECREFLEDRLQLTLNMEKTHITHVNDGFVFLGHRIIRKRGAKGRMHIVSTIPREKFRDFKAKLVQELSGNYSANKIDLIESLNRKLSGWAAFYQFTDYTAVMYSKLDHVLFWRLGYWLARKYRTSIKSLMREWFRRPTPGQAKTWMLFGRSGKGNLCGAALRRMVSSRKSQFRWRNPEVNPYIKRDDERHTVTSRYHDVAMAMSHS